MKSLQEELDVIESETSIQLLRSKGNEAFKKSNFHEAKSCYLQALESVTKSVEDEEKILSNLSACCLALNEPKDALNYANLCIEHKPTWSKGYFRKAKTLLALNEPTLAYIDAVKCAYYESEFKSELKKQFKWNNQQFSEFHVVNSMLDMEKISSSLTSFMPHFGELFNKHIIVVVNNCDIRVKQPLIGKQVVFVGIGKARILSTPGNSSLILVKTNCLLANLTFIHDNIHAIYADNMADLFIHECFFTSSEDERKRAQAQACLCLVNGSKLDMQKSEMNACNECGLLICDNATANITQCQFKNSRLNFGSAVEVRNGAEASLNECNIENYAKGLLIWQHPAHVKVTNCSIVNCRSEGILLTFEPPTYWDRSTYKMPARQFATIVGCKIVGNASFGITVDEKSKAIVSKNEIAHNGCSGLIVKGGVNCTIADNFIHSNKLNGIDIGFNFDCQILVRGNRLKNNQRSQIQNPYETMSRKALASMFSSPLYKKPIVENNIIEQQETDEALEFKSIR
jgi:hypothetical protein